MKSNLVIHPSDTSTVFLSPIYSGLENTSVLVGRTSYDEVFKLCQRHKRILMMGHGSPFGLFAVGQFNSEFFLPYIINDKYVPLFKNQPDNVFIWCNADEFMERNQLKGFYTGMFISETTEAAFCGLGVVEKSIVEASNDAFSAIVHKYINCPKKELYEKVKKEYEVVAKDNIVAAYNHSRLYYS